MNPSLMAEVVRSPSFTLSPITIKEKPLFDSYFSRYPQNIHVNTFASMFLWGEGRDHGFTQIENHLIICYQKKGQIRKWYAPIGPSPEKIILTVCPPSQGYHWTYIDESLSTKLTPLLMLSWDRDMCDYIYSVPQLTTLQGKKFASRRNHLRNFQKTMNEIGAEVRVIRLDASMKEECLRIYEEWASRKQAHVSALEFEDILDDWLAFRTAMEHYDALDVMGIGILINNRLEALSIGDTINQQTAGLLFSKASYTHPQLTTVAIHEFIRALPSHFTLLNRAIDGGIVGLRTSKENWQPLVLAKNYDVRSEMPHHPLSCIATSKDSIGSPGIGSPAIIAA